MPLWVVVGLQQFFQTRAIKKILSPSIRATFSFPIKSFPMIKASAIHWGVFLHRIFKDTPKFGSIAQKFSKSGKSSGVDMIRISRIPEYIKVESGSKSWAYRKPASIVCSPPGVMGCSLVPEPPARMIPFICVNYLIT